MTVVWAGLKEGLRLLLTGDPYLWEIVWLSPSRWSSFC